jgi:hypothetical protein
VKKLETACIIYITAWIRWPEEAVLKVEVGGQSGSDDELVIATEAVLVITGSIVPDLAFSLIFPSSQIVHPAGQEHSINYQFVHLFPSPFIQFTWTALSPTLPYAMSSTHSQQHHSVQAAKEY